MNYAFAERVNHMESSAIREILKVAESPDVISLAGGLPAPELFPIQEIQEAYNHVLGANDPSVLQYSTTEGYLPLREDIAEKMKEKGMHVSPDNILLTNGSQQGLDLIAKLFINPGDLIAVEDPTYLGAIQTFYSYQANFLTVPTDKEGINVDALETAIKLQQPKLIYLTPTYKNPTGVTLSLERRQHLAKILAKYNIPLIEDDPYGELRYSGPVIQPVKSFDTAERIIYLGTFSKTIAPGLRLGWVVASKEIIAKLVLAKQGTDLHTGTLLQRTTHYYLNNSQIEKHIETIRQEYGHRRDIMLKELKANFSGEVSWTEPSGGMFLWVSLPEHFNTVSLLPKAVEAKVAYVPGAPFYAKGGGLNTLRLNFSNSSPLQIQEGIKRLAQLFNK
ncbi:PLP-dependent aminotransferase family protein [Desulfosporosinus sp. SB140]|uniref:aminotransferase-like domain-containing protein n=1 Tax=Desulfosporosinus paludis TaxID=3115649 RepID=UPI003890DD20